MDNIFDIILYLQLYQSICSTYKSFWSRQAARTYSFFTPVVPAAVPAAAAASTAASTAAHQINSPLTLSSEIDKTKRRALTLLVDAPKKDYTFPAMPAMAINKGWEVKFNSADEYKIVINGKQLIPNMVAYMALHNYIKQDFLEQYGVYVQHVYRNNDSALPAVRDKLLDIPPSIQSIFKSLELSTKDILVGRVGMPSDKYIQWAKEQFDTTIKSNWTIAAADIYKIIDTVRFHLRFYF